jgi:site-specific DNA-methyltransferase (adenine-specific)
MQLFNDDCLKVLPTIPENSVDLIITSPPYEDISGAGYTSDTKDILFFKLYSEFIDNVFQQYHRVLKENGQIFFNIKSKTFNKSLRSPHWLEFTSGFQKFIFKSYIIWKYAGSFDSTKSRFHLDYEIVYHLSKGNNIHINDNIDLHDPLSSVWYIPHNIPKNERVHPTQMPIAVVDHILKIVGVSGDTVLDNFMGSGTTGVSCKKNNINFIGIELNPKNFDIAKQRIEITNQN